MDFAELFEAISTHYPSHKGVIMTIAEQLEEKGLENVPDAHLTQQRKRALETS